MAFLHRKGRYLSTPSAGAVCRARRERRACARNDSCNERERSAPQSGTGLGLSAVLSGVELHRGWSDVEGAGSAASGRIGSIRASPSTLVPRCLLHEEKPAADFGFLLRVKSSDCRSIHAYWQMYVFVFHADVAKRRSEPLQLQHWPDRLRLLTMVQAAAQLPLVVEFVAVKP
jgi:hypothetical protein